MNGGVVVNTAAATAHPAGNQQLATDINSYRIGIVAEKLAMSAQKDDPQKFFHLCLSLASEVDSIVEDIELHQNSASNREFQGGNLMPQLQRGIDYGVANNEPPNQASKLAPVLKQVCSRKNEYFLQSAIMVLMISVKNACRLGWFNAKDTQELLSLAEEVGNYFCTKRDVNSDPGGIMPALSSIMTRYYPQYKLGHVIASLEVKPGYGTYLVDFHITKDLLISKDERIRLLVAMRNNCETSSCIVSPQQVNILLNGRPVDKRTNVYLDPGPQAPTIVNQLLKYGTNLLQAVGQFNDHYILVIAAMSTLQFGDLPGPQDYVRADTTISGSDSEIIEGASRISLNCPISYKRIRVPVKGHLCKHYQCFDLGNYAEINLKRPSWRCPHCNQSVCFTDLRVDQMMVKVLQDVGENASEVMISADGSWTVAPSNNRNDMTHDKSTNRQDGHDAEETSVKSDAPSNLCDLTGEDDGMDTGTAQGWESVDRKPMVHDLQGQTVNSNSALVSTSRSSNELNQLFSTQVTASLSSAAMLHGSFSGALTGSFGIAPVLADAVSPSLNQLSPLLNQQSPSLNQQSPLLNQQSHLLNQQSPSLNQQPNHYQGTNYRNDLNLHEALYGRSIPRYVTRTPSAIQALPVQMPVPSSQQYSRPIMSMPATSGSATRFQTPPVSNQLAASGVAGSVDRLRHLPQLHMTPPHMSSMTSASLNRATPQGVSVTPPSYNSWTPQMPQTLSQPPHLMRSSQLPRGHVQQGSASGVGFNNSPSTVQRVQLAPQQATLQMRQHTTQTQSARIPTSVPSNVASPQAVSRTENLIDLQQAEQNWRPTGQMRGALKGQAYSAALSQFMSPTAPSQHTPTPRPPVSATPAALHNHQILMANKMIAQATQMYTRLPPDSTSSETVVSQAGGTQGLN